MEDRDNNVTNGVVAVYTSEAKTYLLKNILISAICAGKNLE